VTMRTEWSAINNQDTVYHYTKIGNAVGHILYDRRLKFSKGINTNDPREYRNWDLEAHLDGDYSYEDFRRNCLEAEKSFGETKAHYKYACFCLNDFTRQTQTRLPGYARLRMWAQYGENFYGVCIAFSDQCLKERLGGNVILYAKPVLYDGDLEHNDTILSDADANKFICKTKDAKDEWADCYIRDHVDQLFFSKHEDYRDEREFRIVVHDPEDIIEYVDVSGCIKAVILGDRTKAAYHEIVKDLCRKMNAVCKQAVWQRGRLHLIDV